MKIEVNPTKKHLAASELLILSAFSKSKKLDISHWDKVTTKAFNAVQSAKHFKGNKDETFFFNMSKGLTVMIVGLGVQKPLNAESIRKALSVAFNQVKMSNKQIEINMEHFMPSDQAEIYFPAALEAIYLSSYQFNRYKKGTPQLTSKVVMQITSLEKKQAQALAKAVKSLTESISVTRDFVNTPPNDLNSETFAKLVEEDAAKLPHVKVKILNKKAIVKEQMGLFLSVNAGSAFEPRLVHLTYTPKNVTKDTKHVALVGKGLTFDSGGYSLKPGGSMMNMKTDMGGAATVYGAFRAAALMGSEIKMSCFLGMTDNMVNSVATVPDSVVKARNGKTVEILNTDAEGRLVLADVLDYACDQNPDQIIDAATLTGAVLVSLGSEICGLMGNNQEFIDSLLDKAKATDEYLWQLPIIPEFSKDMQSPIADLKNIGGSRFGGSSKAAAFLQNFIKNDIPWAHFDIAGVADSQSHLPYCPAKGGSGLMVRTMANYLLNG